MSDADIIKILNSCSALLSKHIGHYSHAFRGDMGSGLNLLAVLNETQSLCERAVKDNRQRISSIHHFACSGGTLLSRCLASQPNVALLSEIDPLSPIPLLRPDFAPYDLLRTMQTGPRPLGSEDVEDIFLNYLKSVQDHAASSGYRVVIRDHTHSHFCMKQSPDERPTVRDILARAFTPLSLVTVRHPIDSFLSLRKKKWVMFEPGTLEEYCNRYMLFLNRYSGIPIVRYEDFVDEPDAVARKMCGLLGLSYAEDWRSILVHVRLSGDSGRSGDEIRARPRRPVPAALVEESTFSESYRALCDRLGYDPKIIAA